MAIVRGNAFKVNGGPERCWTYLLAWDDQIGLSRLGQDDSVKVVARCDQPPIAVLNGSGICADHLARLRRAQNDRGDEHGP
jgi:hypothetical protein